jgi:hypothetical protein
LDNLGIIKNHVGPGRQSHGQDCAHTTPTILRQWRPPPCHTHGFPTAVSPPPVSPPSVHRLWQLYRAPLPHSSATIEPPRSAAPTPPISPSPPRAPRHRVQPSRTESCRPPPPDAAPAAVPLRLTAHHHGARPSGEDLPILTPRRVCRVAEPP